jgi:hypothetical protein
VSSEFVIRDCLSDGIARLRYGSQEARPCVELSASRGPQPIVEIVRHMLMSAPTDTLFDACLGFDCATRNPICPT